MDKIKRHVCDHMAYTKQMLVLKSHVDALVEEKDIPALLVSSNRKTLNKSKPVFFLNE